MNKITEQELEQIKNLKQKYQDLLYNLGVVEMQLEALKKQKQVLLVNINNIQTEEQELTNNLITKYGENTQINTDTGEIS